MHFWMHATVSAALMATPVFFGPVSAVPRSEARSEANQPELVLASADASKSLRPVARPDRKASAKEPQLVALTNHRFDSWVKGFRSTALSHGIEKDTLDRAFSGVIYDSGVIEQDRNQSEFTKTIWDYLDGAVSDTRIKNGKSALFQYQQLLEQIEAQYGVEKEIVVAIWGLESGYGSFRGNRDIVRSLATLAFDGRRGKFFEDQLIAALQILQAGDVSPREMTGSWAGAMGHTQFIPTSYLEYAVDFTGDGKRDIWSDDPSDSLASTAAYLARFGWVKGQPWGVEVTLSDGFDFKLAQRFVAKPPSEWARLGVTDVHGQPVPNHGPGSILLPAGGNGAAFMVFRNFEVLERYNAADAYVIGVGHLGDRISDGLPIQAQWPREDRALTLQERKEMQRRLTEHGFDTKGIDGRIGPNTTAAVRGFQSANGLIPDGYASLALLNRLR